MLIILVSRHITQFFDNDQSLLLTDNNYIHHGWFLLSVKFSNFFFLRRNFISSKELQAAKLLNLQRISKYEIGILIVLQKCRL